MFLRKFLRSFALGCVHQFYFKTERRRRAVVRCAVSDLGEENHRRRGRALAQRLRALRPNGFCRFHVGLCGAAAAVTAAALMAAVADLSLKQ